MTKPITIHTINLSQVSKGKASICDRHIKTPNIGTRGTRGVLNGRSTSGRVLRRIIIDIHTSVKAINVPIDTSSPSTFIGRSPAIRPTAIQVTIVEL